MLMECFQVGHDTSSLTRERTLKSLYIEPILDVLKRQNPITEFVPVKSNKSVILIKWISSPAANSLVHQS